MTLRKEIEEAVSNQFSTDEYLIDQICSLVNKRICEEYNRGYEDAKEITGVRANEGMVEYPLEPECFFELLKYRFMGHTDKEYNDVSREIYKFITQAGYVKLSSIKLNEEKVKEVLFSRFGFTDIDLRDNDEPFAKTLVEVISALASKSSELLTIKEK